MITPRYSDADRFSPELFGFPEPPECSMDRRHVQFIRWILASRLFRSVVEVGVYQGYSATATIDALRNGDIEAATFCDIVISDRARRLLESQGTAATIREERSDAVLGQRGQFDLAIVDGSHQRAVVAVETRLLLRSRAEAVIAHDTNMGIYRNPDGSTGFDIGADGPSLLKNAFQAAGYFCLEDNTCRKSEGTYRGLFFAARTMAGFQAGLTAFRATCCEHLECII